MCGSSFFSLYFSYPSFFSLYNTTHTFQLWFKTLHRNLSFLFFENSHYQDLRPSLAQRQGSQLVINRITLEI